MLQLFNTTAFSWSPDIIDVANAHTIGENFTPSFIPPHTRINRGYYSSGWRSIKKVTIPIWPEHLWLEQQRRRTEKKLHAHISWDGYEYAINNIGPGVKNERNFQWHTQSVKGERLQWLVCERPSGVIPSDAHCSVKNIHSLQIKTESFEENMVMNIELPYYSSKNQTYNIEDTFLVTKTGIELFTKASPSLYI